jgi:hypothetical protein
MIVPTATALRLSVFRVWAGDQPTGYYFLFADHSGGTITVHAKACSHQLRTELADNGTFSRFAIISEATLSRGNWLFHIHAGAFDTSLSWEALRPNTKLRYDCLHSAASLRFANQ